MDWIDRYADALGESDGFGPEERRAVLKLAREVAHRTERVNAPLAAFVAGRHAAGATPEEALREALRVAEGLLPEAADPGG